MTKEKERIQAENEVDAMIHTADIEHRLLTEEELEKLEQECVF